MTDELDLIGFVGGDGVLYCSRWCAKQQGQLVGYEVDQDDYESLAEDASLPPGTLCPGCGAEFSVVWPERQPN